MYYPNLLTILIYYIVPFPLHAYSDANLNNCHFRIMNDTIKPGKRLSIKMNGTSSDHMAGSSTNQTLHHLFSLMIGCKYWPSHISSIL